MELFSLFSLTFFLGSSETVYEEELGRWYFSLFLLPDRHDRDDAKEANSISPFRSFVLVGRSFSSFFTRFDDSFSLRQPEEKKSCRCLPFLLFFSPL